MLNGVDSRAAPNSAASSVTSTPRLPECRKSGRVTAQQSSADGVRSHPVGQRALRTRPVHCHPHGTLAVDVPTVETEELFFMPLPDTSDSVPQDPDGQLAEEEIEVRELSPLGRLPPTPDSSDPYSVAQATACPAVISGNASHPRVSKAQPVSESTGPSNKPLSSLCGGSTSFSVGSEYIAEAQGSCADQPIASSESSICRSTHDSTGSTSVVGSVSMRCIVPTIRPPPPPKSLDFLERCNAVKQQFLRQPVMRRVPAAMMGVSLNCGGARVQDPGRETEQARRNSSQGLCHISTRPSALACVATHSEHPRYPPEALGEGQRGNRSISSVGPLSAQSCEPGLSILPDSGASSQDRQHLPTSRQVQAQIAVSYVRQHSGDLDSAGSAVLEPNAVNGPELAEAGQVMHNGTASSTAVLVPLRGADGSLPPAAADGSIQYCLMYGGQSHTVLLTGDMDDDLDVLEDLEDELGVQVHVQGLAPDALEAGGSSASSLDSESAGRSLGGLSYSPSMLSRKARRNAAGFRGGDAAGTSPLLVRSGAQGSTRTVALRLPMAAMSAQSPRMTSVSHASPADAASVTGALSRTASPEQAGTPPASPVVLPARPVPRLSLQDVDVVALRANIEADAAAIQDDSLMLEPPVYGTSTAVPAVGVVTAPVLFCSPPNSVNEHLGPLSAFEGSAIHAARGAHFKSQRVYAQRSAQQARSSPAAGGRATTQLVPSSVTAAPPMAQAPSPACADFDYDTESNARLLYHDSDIHLAMLTLVLTLLLTSDGQLDPVHSPSDHVTLGAAQRSYDADLCTVMYHHLNHSRNRSVLPGLLQAAHAIGAPAVRLLKLLVHDLYCEDLVGGKPETFARGTFALVQKRRACVISSHRDVPPCYVAEKVLSPLSAEKLAYHLCHAESCLERPASSGHCADEHIS